MCSQRRPKHGKGPRKLLLLRLNERISTRGSGGGVPFGALLDRYIEQELSERVTRLGNRNSCQISESTSGPRWGEHPVDKLKPMAMEQWLPPHFAAGSQSQRLHVRGIMHLGSSSACGAVGHCRRTRQEPLSLWVRVKNGSKRLKRPRVLTRGRVLWNCSSIWANLTERWFWWSHNAWALASAKFWACNGAISISEDRS